MVHGEALCRKVLRVHGQRGWAGCGPGAELGFEEATGWFEVEKLLESTVVTSAEAGGPE